MRFSTLLGEVRRNIISGTTRLAVGFFALLLITMLVSLADLISVNSLQNQARQFVASGSPTRALIAPGQIDASACQRLPESPTVDAAGAISAMPPVRFASMPTVAIQAYRVTTGFAAVVGLNHALPGGVLVDTGLATSMGLHTGARHDMTDGNSLLIGGIFDWPQDGRDQRLSFAVLIPQPATGLFDECWMRAWPVVDANDILLRATQVASSDDHQISQIGQINTTLGLSLDAHQLFANRVTRFAPPVALAAGLALGWVMARTRRLEYASALHAGQSKADQLLTGVLESAVWAVPAAITAVAAIYCVVAIGAMPDAPGLLEVTAPGPILGAAGVLVGTLAGVAGAKEKHLFRLFKNR